MYVELTNRNHVLRSCDEITSCSNIDCGIPVDNWGGCIPTPSTYVGTTIGEIEDSWNSFGFRYRCRVEDAPGPQYVELTDPNHILRPNDELTACDNYGTHEGPDHWLGCLTAEYLERTGETVGQNPWARCRCRVEDNPTKRTRVRLWLVGNLVVSSPDSPCDIAVELHLDSEGFFHEG